VIPLWLDIGGVFAGIIAVVIGGISFVRTIYINKRLNDEPYFKNILSIVKDALSPQIKEVAQHSAEVNQGINKGISDIFKDAKSLYFDLFPKGKKHKLEDIGNFLDKYTLKYDKKFQKSVLQIYDNGVKLRNTIENFNELIDPLTVDFAIASSIVELDNERVKSVRKIIQKYFGKKAREVAVEDGEKGAELTVRILQEYFGKKVTEITNREFWEALENNKRYRKDIRKIRGKILTLTNSIGKDADKFDKKLSFYLLRFGSSPNTV